MNCGCGHTFSKPFPEKPNVTREESERYNSDKGGKVEATDENSQAKEDLKCSVSGVRYESTIIGFGCEAAKVRTGMQISTDLFPLSKESFYEDHIRLSPGGLPITHWIPFVIDEENWKKAKEAAKESVR